MKAYLDYNIFTAIEDGDFSITKIFDKVDSDISECLVLKKLYRFDH